MKDMKKLTDDIVKWMQETVNQAGCKGIIFGLSGGIDSAVVAGLAKRAFPNDCMGIIMPCHSNEQDEKDAILVADAFDLETKKVDLGQTFDALTSQFEGLEENRLALSNVKPRLRMTTLYYYAQKRGYLVAGTGNKSEFTIGYYTKHGDGGVDLMPIVDLVKHEVRDLARYLEVPEPVITKAPSAGLWENQTDEDEMGFTYKELDTFIQTGEAKEEVKTKIERMNKVSEHKRRLPKMFKND